MKTTVKVSELKQKMTWKKLVLLVLVLGIGVGYGLTGGDIQIDVGGGTVNASTPVNDSTNSSGNATAPAMIPGNQSVNQTQAVNTTG